jgi:ADP-ribosyl-[dinitrogen reductase] hydrolase
MTNLTQQLRGALLGLVVGDALGVPVEFMSRRHLREYPVTGMRGYGTHHQPPGTWSDDSALTFQLVETLIEGYDSKRLAERFVRWYVWNDWTPHGAVFDIGLATRSAIDRLEKGSDPEKAGENDEYANGNGSLMRVLPLAFVLRHRPMQERYELVCRVSSLTHRHIRSKIACFFYVELLIRLLKGEEKHEAFTHTQHRVRDYANSIDCPTDERELFTRLFYDDLAQVPESEIFSSGYVLHTLEASIWCFLTTDSYADAVLKAVNLGDDADTTGSVTGGLAGLTYGPDAIPADWQAALARRADIDDLIARFEALLS